MGCQHLWFSVCKDCSGRGGSAPTGASITSSTPTAQTGLEATVLIVDTESLRRGIENSPYLGILAEVHAILEDGPDAPQDVPLLHIAANLIELELADRLMAIENDDAPDPVS